MSHVLPTNCQLNDGTITYGYDASIGALAEVAHLTSRVRFTYDVAGRQDSLKVSKNVAGSETLGVIERRQYDADGQLVFMNRIRKEGAQYLGLLTNTLSYDARGKITNAAISSAAVDVGVQTAKTSYSGLGAVVASEKWNAVGWESEQFRTTAMGEVVRSRSDVGSQVNHYPVISSFDIHGALKLKQPVRPYLDPLDSLYTDTTYAHVDNAGECHPLG